MHGIAFLELKFATSSADVNLHFLTDYVATAGCLQVFITFYIFWISLYSIILCILLLAYKHLIIANIIFPNLHFDIIFCKNNNFDIEWFITWLSLSSIKYISRAHFIYFFYKILPTLWWPENIPNLKLSELLTLEIQTLNLQNSRFVFH